VPLKGKNLPTLKVDKKETSINSKRIFIAINKSQCGKSYK
jgi:hypothetical protein